jgi:hypothetical protein
VLEDRLAPATLTVNSTADTASDSDPYLSLREAIAIFNSPTLPSDLSAAIRGQLNGTLHGGGTDTIVFDHSAVSSPIVLSGTQLRLSLPGSMATLSIDGGAAVTVDGNNASRVLQVAAGVQVSLHQLLLTHGLVTGIGVPSDGGGAIENEGTLTVMDCTLTASSAEYGGGGILNLGTLTVSDSTLSADTATGFGGGIDNEGGTVTVSNTALLGNSGGNDGGGLDNEDTMTLTNSYVVLNSTDLIGGGVYNGGTLTVQNSTLGYNTSASDGGGLYNVNTLTVDNSSLSFNLSGGFGGGLSNQARATVSNSNITGNIANIGGGIDNEDSLTVTNTGISSNSAVAGFANSSGGGVYNQGTLSLTYCTLEANSAPLGGGIDNEFSMTVDSCGLNGNVASNLGGGIYNTFELSVTDTTLSSNSVTSGDGGGIYNDQGDLLLTSSTLAGNSATNGGGIFQSGGGSPFMALLQNTIVAGNRASANHGPDINGAVDTFSSYNLVGVGDSTLTGISNGTNHNQVGTTASPIDPRLSPLGYYGGPTPTFALLSGSPAHNAGDPGSPLITDQRGLPRLVAGSSDVGAFQTQANPFLVSTRIDPGLLPGLLSLREAVNLANVLPGTNTISFDPTLDGGLISLIGGQLELSGTGGVQTIDGLNRFGLSGGGSTRLLQVDAGTQVVIRNLDLGGGSAATGGALLNGGTTILDNSAVYGNVATSNGGAIYNTGTLTLRDSTLESNTAGAAGAGIYNAGQLTAFNSTFFSNVARGSGGAIDNVTGGTATLTSLSISRNFAPSGGGLEVDGAPVQLRNCIVAGNNTLDATAPSDITGTLAASSSYDLIGTGGSGGLTDGVNHNHVGVANPGLMDPNLTGPLTPVFGLTASSPALGAGDPTLLSDPDLRLDQHGNARSNPPNIGAV